MQGFVVQAIGCDTLMPKTSSRSVDPSMRSKRCWGIRVYRPPKDIFEYKAFVDSFKKHRKLAMPFIVNAFVGTQHGKAAKRRILQGYLAGCPGGFIERSSIDHLIDFMKDPLG